MSEYLSRLRNRGNRLRARRGEEIFLENRKRGLLWLLYQATAVATSPGFMPEMATDHQPDWVCDLFKSACVSTPPETENDGECSYVTAKAPRDKQSKYLDSMQFFCVCVRPLRPVPPFSTTTRVCSVRSVTDDAQRLFELTREQCWINPHTFSFEFFRVWRAQQNKPKIDIRKQTKTSANKQTKTDPVPLSQREGSKSWVSRKKQYKNSTKSAETTWKNANHEYQMTRSKNKIRMSLIHKLRVFKIRENSLNAREF